MSSFREFLYQQSGDSEDDGYIYCALYFRTKELDRIIGTIDIQNVRPTLDIDKINDAAQEHGDEFLGAVLVGCAYTEIEARVYVFRPEDGFTECVFEYAPGEDCDAETETRDPEDYSAYNPLADVMHEETVSGYVERIAEGVAEWNIEPLRYGWSPETADREADYRKTTWTYPSRNSNLASIKVRYSYDAPLHLKVEGEDIGVAYAEEPLTSYEELIRSLDGN